MIEQFKLDIDGNVAPLAERIFIESGLERYLRTDQIKDQSAVENINELIAGAHEYDSQAENPSVLDYLQQIALFSDVDAYDEYSDRVALMTLHAAKGLEFEDVFIVGLEDGLLPHEKSSDDKEQLEEERRLFFVGLTRAKSGLHLSYVRYRNFRGQLVRTIPSQFLFELGIDFEDADNDYSGDDGDVNKDIPIFRPGQLVRHKSFGLGTIKDYIDMGENSVVVVRFNNGRTKTLMVKYAPLYKL